MVSEVFTTGCYLDVSTYCTKFRARNPSPGHLEKTFIYIYIYILTEGACSPIYYSDKERKEKKHARGISPIVFDRSGSSASESCTGIK